LALTSGRRRVVDEARRRPRAPRPRTPGRPPERLAAEGLAEVAPGGGSGPSRSAARGRAPHRSCGHERPAVQPRGAGDADRERALRPGHPRSAR
jgi:hypothetical protein